MTVIDAPVSPEPQQAKAGAVASWRIDIPGATLEDLRPIKWQLYLSLVGLAAGALMGILQALERLDVNLYDDIPLQTYYQGLTLHGVALALVFTFCFANSLLSLTTMRGFGRPMIRSLSVASVWSAWIGTALALWAILANKATVMFTFYAPLKATPAFYIGAVLLVISTWLVLLNMLLTLRLWRKEQPAGKRIPLVSFISIMSYIMWFIASLGIAIEVLAILLPWSMGITDKVDPQFTRVLFWFSGHPIVYFWLMPIYVAWYTQLPKQVGGRIFSDSITRMVFIAFLLLIPVGVHHQFTDPGVPFTSKTSMWILTFFIFYPSIITAFSIFTALEEGGRKRGGKGLLGWIPKLPWGDPVVAGQLLAGLGFMLGGASGLINASYTLNLQVHNTAFIPGHFHLTVGTAVALSIMAISYWMIPYFTGKQLFSRKLAVAQVWTWMIGVLIFSRGQMWAGLEGMPRRTMTSQAPHFDEMGAGWEWGNRLTGIGGSIMFISAVMFFIVVIGTIYSSKIVTELQVVPVSEVRHGPKVKWALLDDIKIWVVVAVLLTVVIYGELVWHYLPLNSVSVGYKLW